MKKSNKKLATILLVFALVFVLGGVYAAASGVLTFQGTAKLNDGTITDDLWLEIHESKTQPAPISNDSVSTGTMSITPDRQTANITVNLDKPGSEVMFTFDVKNVGTLDAYLFDFGYNSSSHGDDLSKILDFTGSYTNLENSTIDVGNEVTNLTLGVKWKEGAEMHAGEQVSFQLTIAYVDNDAYSAQMAS